MWKRSTSKNNLVPSSTHHRFWLCSQFVPVCHLGLDFSNSGVVLLGRREERSVEPVSHLIKLKQNWLRPRVNFINTKRRCLKCQITVFKCQKWCLTLMKIHRTLLTFKKPKCDIVSLITEQENVTGVTVANQRSSSASRGRGLSRPQLTCNLERTQ